MNGSRSGALASRDGGCWPTTRQETLLAAALASGDAAVRAWYAWGADSDLDQIDSGSRRLLPMVYRTLQRAGVSGPSLARLKSVYRHSWYTNQLLLANAATVLRAFEREGIQTLVLKGAALTALYYQDAGVRPMNDLDLLVPTAQGPTALHLAERWGWRPYPGFVTPRLLLPAHHACAFLDRAGREIDLHWHLLPECLAPDADTDLWSGSLPLTLGGTSTRALNAADQLLHTCVHGTVWNRVPPFRWVADATLILRSDELPVDWVRLLEQARARRLTLPLFAALRYLRRRWGAPVPAWVLDRLRQTPVTLIERLAFRERSRPPRPLLGDTLRSTYRFLLAPGETHWSRRIGGYPRYLQRAWSLEHIWQMPAHVGRRASERLSAHKRPFTG